MFFAFLHIPIILIAIQLFFDVIDESVQLFHAIRIDSINYSNSHFHQFRYIITTFAILKVSLFFLIQFLIRYLNKIPYSIY